MGSYFVVVRDPFIEQLLRVRKVIEPARVEALVAKLAVEAFDETVLHGFARLDEVGEDATVVGPGVEVVGGKLGAVVARDAQRRPVLLDEAVEDFGHVPGPKRALRHDGETPSVEGIEDVEGAKALTVAELVVHEVHAPVLARSVGGRQCDPGLTRSLLTAFGAQTHPFVEVEAPKAMHPDLDILPLEQHFDSPVPEARTRGTQVANAQSKRLVARTNALVALGPPGLSEKPTRTPLRKSVPLLDFVDQDASTCWLQIFLARTS